MAYIDNVKAILEKDYFRKDAGWHIDIKDTKKNNGVVLSTIIVGNKNQKVAIQKKLPHKAFMKIIKRT